MSTEQDPPEEGLGPEAEQAAQGDTRAEDLTDELARKYDPSRLLKMVSRRAGRGESLDHSIRSKYEKRFGVDLGHVRIYTGEFAEEFNRQRNAYAVTIGSTGMILMGGSPDKSMGSASGKALLAHELTHVAQAKRGLHNKSFSGTMPFAEDHDHIEGEAESEEAHAHAEESGTREAADAGSAALDAAEALELAMVKVRERVFEMASDAARTQLWRNSSQRRA